MPETTYSGQVNADLSKLVKQMSHEELKREVETLLQRDFSHLGEIEERTYFRQQMGRVSLSIGRYLVDVSGTRVQIDTLGRYQPGDVQIVRQLRQALTDLVAGLAGMALQRQIAREVINASHVVSRLYRQPDGSVVMEMEWGRVVVHLSGEISFTTPDQGVIARLATDLAGAGIVIVLIHTL